jgi:plasmid stabilization system protein ParE
MKIILADKAKGDLIRIYSYVEQRSPLAGEKILARIDNKFDQLVALHWARTLKPRPGGFAVQSLEFT